MTGIARVCVVCGAANAGLLPFPADMREGVCTQHRCRHVVHVRLHAHRAAVAQRRDDAIRASIGGAEPIVLVPSNPLRTSRLPAHRRAAFAAFLEARLAESIDPSGTITPYHEAPQVIAPLSTQESRAASQACATCRGSCCRSGGNTAWLTTDTLRRVRHDSSLDTAALRDAYLRDLPQRSYAHSCVYHTVRGCALTPALRSDTCHRYLCAGLESLVTLVRSGVSSARVAATQDVNVARVRRLSLRDDASPGLRPEA